MSEFPHLPIFTRDFIGDTTHLSATETGSYLMLLFVAWQSPGCRLADNDASLARCARVDARTWRRIKPTIMAFWSKDDEGFWVQKRLTATHEKVTALAAQKRANGRLGGRPKSLETKEAGKAIGSGELKLPESYAKQSKSKPSKEGSAGALSPSPKANGKGIEPPAYTADFEAAWTAYPKTKTANPKLKAFEVWQRLSEADRAAAFASLPAFGKWCSTQWDGYQAPGFAVFLRGRRFDEFAPGGSSVEPLPDPARMRAGLLLKAGKHFAGEWRPGWGAAPGEPGCEIPDDVIRDAAAAAGAPWPPSPPTHH
jgi:uncharacterized protein YdaU (DUF1376 family)